MMYPVQLTLFNYFHIVLQFVAHTRVLTRDSRIRRAKLSMHQGMIPDSY